MADLVYKVNALGPKYIAEACKEVGAKMAKTLSRIYGNIDSLAAASEEAAKTLTFNSLAILVLCSSFGLRYPNS